MTVLATILSFTVGPLVQGFILSQLWKWLVAPVFHLAPLTILDAYGLTVMLTYLKGKQKVDLDKSWSEVLLEGWLFIAISGAFALAFGWVIARLRG